jgi:hypothetical protein
VRVADAEAVGDDSRDVPGVSTPGDVSAAVSEPVNVPLTIRSRTMAEPNSTLTATSPSTATSPACASRAPLRRCRPSGAECLPIGPGGQAAALWRTHARGMPLDEKLVNLATNGRRVDKRLAADCLEYRSCLTHEGAPPDRSNRDSRQHHGLPRTTHATTCRALSQCSQECRPAERCRTWVCRGVAPLLNAWRAVGPRRARRAYRLSRPSTGGRNPTAANHGRQRCARRRPSALHDWHGWRGGRILCHRNPPRCRRLSGNTRTPTIRHSERSGRRTHMRQWAPSRPAGQPAPGRLRQMGRQAQHSPPRHEP